MADDSAIELSQVNLAQGLGEVPLGLSHLSEGTRLHFPDGVAVSWLLQVIATWSGIQFVMDPGLERQVQITAPQNLGVEECFHLFLVSLDSVQLRAVPVGAKVFKIAARKPPVLRV